MEKVAGGGGKRKGKPIRGSSKGRRKRPGRHSGGKHSADKSTLIESIQISDQLSSPLGEKGATAKGILCDGGCGPASGCLSPTVLSRQTCLTTLEEPMPVTSRAKRLKGATTTGQPSDQHHLSPNTTRIPKTDRRTRSASCQTSNSNTATLEVVLALPLRNDKSPEVETLSEESSSKIILNPSPDSNQTLCEGALEIKPDKKVETSERESGLGSFSISLEVEKGETLSGQCQPGLPSETRVKKRSVDRKTARSKSTNDQGPVSQSNSGNNNNRDYDRLGLSNSNPPEESPLPMTVPVTSSQVVSQPSCAGGGSNSDSSPRSDSIREVLAEKSGSSIKTNPNKFKNEQKLNLAPMLLMNNLPYMGELTFDTRPRRGRKPKKADICHLISKNYGIHFPISYTNVPNTGSYPVGVLPKHQSKLIIPPAAVSAISKGKGRKNSSKSSTFSSCPPQQQPLQNWTFSPPALLPITKSLNNLLSTTPATVTHSKGSSRSAKSLSKNRVLSSNGTSIRSTASNELHRPNQTLSFHNPSGEEYYSSSCSNNGNCAKQIKGDEPLNLCVRDASLVLKNAETDERNNYATMMNLSSFPSQGLFSDFHLRQQAGKRLGQAGLKRGSSCSSTNYSNKISKVASEKVISDSNLVNNLSFQLALANTLHGQSSSQHQMNKSLRRNPSHSQQFEPLITIEAPGGSEGGQNRKSRKRPYNSNKHDDSFNDSPPSLLGSVSSNTFQNSSVHLGANPSPDNHVRCGLFGQPDLGGSSSEAQVSICKFKFTGGAKPSLQEKKMLSVDSGGNFRFFTDKCNTSGAKGLKNCGSSSTSGQGSGSSFFNSFESNGGGSGEQDCQYAFSALPKSAKSMSVCMPVRTPSVPIPIQGSSKQPIDSKGLELVRTGSSPPFPVSPTTVAELQNLHFGGLEIPPPSLNYSEEGYSSSDSELSNSGHPSPGGGPCSGSNNPLYPISVRNKERLKKKRRTRKSLMREKLEKTFKEKGFLIQTQQLESAEGATYCKFRQLRKFTRYLFRSWKDYLPDNVKEINIGVNEAEGSSGVPTTLATIGSGGSSGAGGGEIGGSGAQTLQLDLTTVAATTRHHQRNNCSRVDDDGDDDNDDRDNENEDCEEDDDEVIDHVPVGPPHVTSTRLPLPSSTSVKSNNNNSTDDDSDASNDVDVENIDGQGDPSSVQYSANIVIKRESNDEDDEDNGDNTPEDLVAND